MTEKALISSNVTHLIVNTGNILASETMKRKVTLLPTEEVVEGLTLIVSNGKKDVPLVTQLNDGTAIVVNKQLSTRVENEERSSSKVIVKVFSYSDECKTLKGAVDFVMEQLGVTVIDSLVVALAPRKVRLTLDQMKPVWSCAEKIVEEGKVTGNNVGVSDLDTEQLIQLYQWSNYAKPTTNQVNLESCCVIPPEMTTFAQENKIQLLTHSDPRDIMPQEKLEVALSGYVEDPSAWRPHWLARYSVVVRGKGIIRTKGYILSTLMKD